MLSLFAVAAAAVVAAPPPTEYVKKAVAVYGLPGDLLVNKLQGELSATGRFEVLDAVPGGDQPVDKFMKVAAAAGQKAGGGTFVLAPKLDFGQITSTSPAIDKNENKDGSYSATAAAYLECPYTLAIVLYDAQKGQPAGQVTYTATLKRRFEYRYDDRTSREALQYKAHELARVMAQEAGRPPAQAFASQARDARSGVVQGVLGELKRHPLFRLDVKLSGWSNDRDRVNFNLGKALRVGIDDGFAVMRGGRKIGYLKVRELTETASEAQPLWLDELVNADDRIVEAPKAMWNHGLRVGPALFGSQSLLNAGYVGEIDIGPSLFNAPERYLTFGLGALSNFSSAGVSAELGYAQKLTFRRYALRLGWKALAFQLDGTTGSLPLPGAALSTGLEYHFNEHVLVGADVDLAGFWPYIPINGPRVGQTIYTFGPITRAGLTVLF